MARINYSLNGKILSCAYAIMAVRHTASRNIECGAIDRLDESSCTRVKFILCCKHIEEKERSAKLFRLIKVTVINMLIFELNK